MRSPTFQKQYSQYEEAMPSFLQVDLAPLNTVQRKFCISILYVNFPGYVLNSGNRPNIQNTESGKCHNLA